MTWLVYLKREWNEPTKQELYLAQIAYVIVKTQAVKKDAKKIKFKDFILKFDTEDKKPEKSSPESRLKKSKTFWGTFLAGSTKRKK